MGRTWVLHTETKGTGAQMVPLERVTKRSSDVERVFVPRKPRRSPEPEAPSANAPHEFRILDVLTRETLADRAGIRDALGVLRGLRSPVDVNVYVWRDQPGRWRLLTLEEKRALWELRNA